jgi:putative transposase
MARIARIVVPGYPHHIIQRGNRRQRVFFNDEDRKVYLDYLRIHAKPAGIHFWGYCLMDNHVHIIAVPDKEESFAFGFAEAHRRYTRMINFRENWRGYLWEGRFKSYPLSEFHLYAAIRYIERNPVRAKVVKNPWDYFWSSARAHTFKEKDPLLDDNFVISEIKDWKIFLSEEDEPANINLLKTHANTGRPLGDNKFIEMLEKLTSRLLRKQKPGPKEKEKIIK